MADEFVITYQHATYTPYVVIRRQSDYYAWSTVTSAFAAWADGSIADYDVALTSRGGDMWTGDFPSAIPAGYYRIQWYESTGTPAITDLILKSRDVYWNGATAVSGASVSLSPYALTTLAGVKRHMRITSSADDTLLTELINQASAYIERITGRLFKARDYHVRLSGGGRRAVLPRYPVQYIRRITYGTLEAISVSYSGAAIRANVSVYTDGDTPTSGGVRLVSVSSVGVTTTTTLAFSSYPTTSLLATAIAAVSGWSATATVNVPTVELRIVGGQDATTAAVRLEYYSEQDVNAYSTVNETGIVVGSLSGRNGSECWAFDTYPFDYVDDVYQGGSLVEYRAGYETIPDDVDYAARELVKEMYFAGRNNTGVRSFSLGPYSVTFTDDQAARIRMQLAPYIDGAAMVAG